MGTNQTEEKLPKYRLIEQQLAQAIEDKQYTSKLPGERVLAGEFGCSYMTIRKAMANLVARGLLYTVPQKGAYVSDAQRPKARKHTIGYFLDSSMVAGISSPYYSLIFNALESLARHHGYSLVYFSDASENLEKTLSKVDGVIASCFPRIELLLQDIKQHVPVVVIDNAAADKTIPSVIIDNFNAVKDSVEHVISLGHERIGFMTGLEDSDVGTNRFAGYQFGLQNQGFVFCDQLVFRGNYSYASGMEGAEYFMGLKERPTAILCANDSMALGTMARLSQSNIQVPQEISVMGFDDIDVAAQVVPALCTLRAPIKQISQSAFEMLLCMIENKTPDSAHIALPARIIKRQTTTQVTKSTQAA